MRSSWKVWKRGWAHRQQTTLTQTYKNLFSDTTNASIPGVTVLKSMYIFFVYNDFFFSLLVLFRAHQRFLSK
jgi:hypothetical protein